MSTSLVPALPPGPRSAILSTASIIRDPYGFQRRLRARYGDFVTVPSLNGKVVFGFTPAMASAVFTADASTFVAWGSKTIAAVLEPESVLVTDGERHKRDRRLLMPPFHGSRMRAYGDVMRRTARTWLRRWQPGSVEKVHDTAISITLDVILQTIFGVREEERLAEGRKVVLDLIHGFHPALMFTSLLHTRMFPPWARFLRTRALVMRWVGDRIAEARARVGVEDDVLGMLLAARYDDGSAMTDREIVVQLSALVISGYETISIAVAWGVHWLLSHPAALAALRNELDSVGIDADADTIAALPYLSAVCDETLRLYPMVTETYRSLAKPLTVGDRVLPPGIGIAVGISSIHEDPAIYPEPQRFRPERFLARKYSPFEFMPFGGGNRRCIGAAFGLYELKLVLATIVADYELALEALDAERPVRRHVTLGPKHGVRVRVLGRRVTPRVGSDAPTTPPLQPARGAA